MPNGKATYHVPVEVPHSVPVPHASEDVNDPKNTEDKQYKQAGMIAFFALCVVVGFYFGLADSKVNKEHHEQYGQESEESDYVDSAPSTSVRSRPNTQSPPKIIYVPAPSARETYQRNEPSFRQCSSCNGTGRSGSCKTCWGKGEIWKGTHRGFGDSVTCMACSGTGKLLCRQCNGRGTTP